MSTSQSLKDKLKSLKGKISCTKTDCKSDLHCFRQTSGMKAANESGKCRDCGTELSDWHKLQQMNIDDAEQTFALLKKEYIRHYFWHTEIDQGAINHALNKGRIQLRESVVNRLKKSIGTVHEMPKGVKRPYKDGYQTPFEGNSIYYAQHATASCCRSCLEYCHGIPQGRDLTEKEINYLTDLIMLYLNERIPRLADHPQKQPRIQKKEVQACTNS
jgi:Domain of unknown function (DUF4186)